MNVEKAPIAGEAIMFGNAAADLGSSIGGAAKDTGMMLYNGLDDIGLIGAGGSVISSVGNFYGSTLPNGLKNAGPAIKGYMTDNWPDSAGMGVSLALAFTPLNPVMDIVDLVTMATDLVDPRGYSSQIERTTFTDLSTQLLSAIQDLRRVGIEDIAKDKYGVNIKEGQGIKPEFRQKIEKELDESMGSTFGRFYRIDERTPFDIHFQKPNGATGTLNQCVYIDYNDLGKSLNFMLNTSTCPDEYIQAYKDYYVSRHPSTQISDCKVSDGFLDLKSLNDDLRCRTLKNKLGYLSQPDGKFVRPKSETESQETKDLDQEWSDLNCSSVDYSKEYSDLQFSTDPNRTYGDCELDSTDGKLYRKRSKVVFQAPKNGGRECGQIEEKELCPDIDCKMGDWYHYNAEGSKTSGWSDCTQSSECIDLNQKKKTSVLSSDDQLTWDQLNCNTKSNGELYQNRFRDIITPSQNNGQACGLTYEEQSCKATECVMSPNWTDLSEGCVKGSMMCPIWEFDEKNNADIYCTTPNCLSQIGYTQEEANREKQRRKEYCSSASNKYYIYQTRETITPGTVGTKPCETRREVECSAIDCKVSPWTDWSECYQLTNETTGEVYSAKTRKRTVTEPAKEGGSCNAELWQEEKCATNDCKLTPWSEWSECYPEDKKYLQARYRTIEEDPLNGGKSCPVELSSYYETRECKVEGFRHRRQETIANPGGQTPGVLQNVNCETSSWSEWSPCIPGKEPNDSYFKIRTKSISVYPKNEGTGCGPLEEFQTCIVQNCEVSPWTETSCYLNTNGTYEKMLHRKIVTSPSNGGLSCPELTKTEPCVPVNCKTSDWSEWSSCYESSPGLFKQLRSRGIETYPENGGLSCDTLYEEKECSRIDSTIQSLGVSECYIDEKGEVVQSEVSTIDVMGQYGGVNPSETGLQKTFPCPKQDCDVTEWSEWTKCYKSGETYQKSRFRDISSVPVNGGQACPSLVENEACPVKNCETSEWSNWTPCVIDETTNQPVQYRTKTIVTVPENGGESCPALIESQSCSTTKDCVVSEWSEWSECMEEDGEYRKARRRQVVQAPVDGGKLCDTLLEEKKCDPSDCEYTSWSEWTSCGLESDDKYYKYRTRDIEKVPGYGGESCDLNTLQEKEECPTECKYSDWSEWSDCYTLDSTEYIKSRTRELLSGSKACEESLIESQSCPPSHCKVSEWKSWGDCTQDKITGEYNQYRTRDILEYPSYGGVSCPDLVENQKCDVSKPVDCMETGWTSWSECYPTENNKYEQVRTRDILQYSKNGGTECGPLIEKQECAPSECEYTNWSEWTTCYYDASGVYQQSRTRDVSQVSKNGGLPCTNVVEHQVCGDEKCTYGDWNDWSKCYQSEDGKYRQLRTRPLVSGGSTCENTVDAKVCEPVNCQTTNWSEWSECRETSPGILSKVRTRSVETPSKYGGASCGSLIEESSCSIKDCEVSPWSEWSECLPTTEDNRWEQIRTRSVTEYPTIGKTGIVGKECPFLEERKTCDKQDCQVSPWTDWSSCYSDENGIATQLRLRDIVYEARYGGSECPDLYETRRCV